MIAGECFRPSCVPGSKDVQVAEEYMQWWLTKVMDLTVEGGRWWSKAKRQPQEINLQINLIACYQLHKPKSTLSNSKRWQWPTHGHSYALLCAILSFWYYALLITTAPLRAAGILHCTRAKQIFRCCLRGVYTGMGAGQPGRAPSSTSIWISGYKWEPGALCRHRYLSARSAISYSNAFCIHKCVSFLFTSVWVFCCLFFFFLWAWYLCKEKKKNAWNLLLTLCVACL